MRTTARGMWDPEYGRIVFEISHDPQRRRAVHTLYGLLAQDVTMPDDRSWIEFTAQSAGRNGPTDSCHAAGRHLHL